MLKIGKPQKPAVDIPSMPPSKRKEPVIKGINPKVTKPARWIETIQQVKTTGSYDNGQK